MLGVTRNAILCACQFPQIIPIMFSSSVSCATIWATEDNSSHHLAKASALSTTQNPLTSVSRYVLRIANIQQVFLYKFFPTGVTRNNIKKEILYCFFTRINRHIFFYVLPTCEGDATYRSERKLQKCQPHLSYMFDVLRNVEIHARRNSFATQSEAILYLKKL